MIKSKKTKKPSLYPSPCKCISCSHFKCFSARCIFIRFSFFHLASSFVVISILWNVSDVVFFSFGFGFFVFIAVVALPFVLLSVCVCKKRYDWPRVTSIFCCYCLFLCCEHSFYIVCVFFYVLCLFICEKKANKKPLQIAFNFFSLLQNRQSTAMKK